MVWVRFCSAQFDTEELVSTHSPKLRVNNTQAKDIAVYNLWRGVVLVSIPRTRRRVHVFDPRCSLITELPGFDV